MEASTQDNPEISRRPRLVNPTTGSDLGEWIRSQRLAQNVRQRELAGRAGISRTYLSDIERGRCARPSIDCLARIASALGADRNEVLREAGILDSPGDPGENALERKLLAVFRGLNEGNREALERFARFLLSEEQHWVQPRLVDGEHERKPRRAGPSLFDATSE